MAPRASFALVLFGLLAAGLTASAAESNTAANGTEPAKRARTVSPGVAAALAAGMPKYSPPKPAPKDDEEQPDLRESDKPRNQIIRLPDYVVREKKPPVFRERDINTTKGLSALAMKRYFSETGQALNKFTLPLFGMGAEAYAQAMRAEQERLDNIAGLKATAADLKALGGDSDFVNQEVNRTYIRTDDYGFQTKK